MDGLAAKWNSSGSCFGFWVAREGSVVRAKARAIFFFLFFLVVEGVCGGTSFGRYMVHKHNTICVSPDPDMFFTLL